jgi:hypothetical protein
VGLVYDPKGLTGVTTARPGVAGVLQEASASSVKVGIDSGDDVEGCSGSSSTPSIPYSSPSTKMLSTISLSPAYSKTS